MQEGSPSENFIERGAVAGLCATSPRGGPCLLSILGPPLWAFRCHPYREGFDSRLVEGRNGGLEAAKT